MKEVVLALLTLLIVALGVFIAPYIMMIDFNDLGSEVKSDPEFIYIEEGR